MFTRLSAPEAGRQRAADAGVRSTPAILGHATLRFAVAGDASATVERGHGRVRAHDVSGGDGCPLACIATAGLAKRRISGASGDGGLAIPAWAHLSHALTGTTREANSAGRVLTIVLGGVAAGAGSCSGDAGSVRSCEGCEFTAVRHAVEVVAAALVIGQKRVAADMSGCRCRQRRIPLAAKETKVFLGT